jgi:acetyl-CoA C-acetyltransferase
VLRELDVIDPDAGSDFHAHSLIEEGRDDERLYSTEPPAAGLRHADPQAEVDALPARGFVGEHEGPVTIESYTVMHERDNTPALGIVACLLPDGHRAWANTRDPDLMKAMTVEELCGRAATLDADGTIEVA